jgi:hypothetical protein
MRKVRTEESGLEEWACPTCGRRMLLRWPPDYEKQVIEAGDQKACHVGHTSEDPAEDPAASSGATQADLLQMNNGRRWLRETGVDARERLSQIHLPPEPV